MKIVSSCKMEIMNKGTETSKDGKTTYYRLAVLQGMEAGKLGCSEDVYNHVRKGEEYIFRTEYNDEYKSFRITGVDAVPKPSNATVPPAK